MKRIFTLILLVFILIGQAGCEKRLIDYRNKYVGSYAITTRYSWYDENMTIQSEEVKCKGEVYYNRKDHDKGELVVVYDGGQERPVRINRKGEVTDHHTTGKFADRDNFEISFSTSPIPQQGYGIRIVGTRN